MVINLNYDFPISTHGNDRYDLAIVQMFSDIVTVVPFVCNDDFRVRARFGHNRHKAFHIRYFTSRKCDSNREAKTVCSQMDFGREATARAAKILALSPPFAPAAC